jgi:cell division protein FtsN
MKSLPNAWLYPFLCLVLTIVTGSVSNLSSVGLAESLPEPEAADIETEPPMLETDAEVEDDFYEFLPNSSSEQETHDEGEPRILVEPNNLAPNNSPYVVAIPARRDDLLDEVQEIVPTASLNESRRGQYIQAGAFPRRSLAEDLSRELRKQGFDARVVYFRAR